MSLGSILGVLFGFGLFASAIVMATDNYGMFLSIPSAIMVIGGTLAASFIAYQARYVLLALSAVQTKRPGARPAKTRSIECRS